MHKNCELNPTTDISIIRQSLLWLENGRGVAIATVIETWGSAPRPIGSQMAIEEKGAFVGSVSGGCVEGDVVTEALKVIRKKENKEMNYDISNNDAQQVGLACGGKLKIIINWICSKKKKALNAIVRSALNFQPVWLQINIRDGTFKTIFSNHTNTAINTVLYPVSQFLESTTTSRTFIRAFIPAPRLLIVGGVHIAQILSNLALEAGYEVILIDPRDNWATPQRFPKAKINRRWPSTAIQELSPDHRTAVVTLSHDPKIDDPALISALKSDAFYIGSLGSRKTHALRVKRLISDGLEADQIARIFAPVGISINAKTPFEIAISIMAQIINTYQTRFNT